MIGGRCTSHRVPALSELTLTVNTQTTPTAMLERILAPGLQSINCQGTKGQLVHRSHARSLMRGCATLRSR